MPNSMQVYMFRDAEEVEHIINQLRRHKPGLIGEWIVNLTSDSDDMIEVTIRNRIFRPWCFVFITLFPLDNRLIVQGASADRHRVIEFLIETFSVGFFIHGCMLGNRWRQLLESITDVDERNRITSITARDDFGEDFILEGEHHHGMIFSSVNNRSTLQHQYLGTLLERVKTCKMKLYDCAHLVKDDKPLTMIIDNNCSFRLFTNRNQAEWNRFYVRFLRNITLH